MIYSSMLSLQTRGSNPISKSHVKQICQHKNEQGEREMGLEVILRGGLKEKGGDGWKDKRWIKAAFQIGSRGLHVLHMCA